MDVITAEDDDLDDLRLVAAFRAALPWLREPLGVVSAQRARELIALNGFSAAFVATVLNVAPETVRRWVAGDVEPCHQYGPRWQKLLALLEQRARIAGVEADAPNTDPAEEA